MNHPPEPNWTERPWRGVRGDGGAGAAVALLMLAVAAVWPWRGLAQDAVPVASEATARAAEREIARREGLVHDAEAVLREGDLLYSKGMLREATGQYRNAFLALAQAPIAKPLREVALSKYERAGTEYAQQLVREGRFDEAKRVVEELLDPSVGSTYVTARQLHKRLAGDEFYNRAITPEHVANVGKVEELLRKGNHLIELGDFDGASMEFARVLAIDPHNTGARRALERVDKLVAEHADAGYDHTRAKMLREVMETWETKQPVAMIDSGAGAEFAAAGRAADPASALRAKLHTIVFPEVVFSGTSIEDVVEYLKQRSRELDTIEQDPAKKGVSIVLNLGENGGAAAGRPVNLRLRSVPLVEILNYATQQAGLAFRVDEFAVTVTPLGATSDALVMRKFRVPPSFLSGGAMGGGGGAAGGAAADPFAAPAEEKKSELAARLSAADFLRNNGVTFPPGAFAQFVPETSTLIVKNTSSNLDLVETIVLGSRSEIPRQVLIEVRVIDSTETHLKEIGFDWLLGAFSVGSDGVFGSGGTLGSTRAGNAVTTGAAGDFPLVLPPSNPAIAPAPGLVTSGLRSGQGAVTSDGIADVIANSATGSAVAGAATPVLGPGVFAVTGTLTDPQFEVVMRAISQDKGTDVLAVPSVVVRSGERAEFRSVREFIYPTEYDPPELPNRVGSTSGIGVFPVTPANPTAFEMRELGNLLQVEPLIGPDDITVDLNLVPEVSDFIGFINYGSPITAGGAPITANRIVMPVFKTLKESTSVTVYDGETVVLGGLLESAVSDVEDKVPIIGDVPIIGRFFRSSVERRQLRAIVLFVKVRILDPAGVPVNQL